MTIRERIGARRIAPQAAPHLVPGDVRTLGPADVVAFRALAERDPVVNVFVDYRARTTLLDPRWLGGQVVGLQRGDELVAACHMGANLVPIGCSGDDVLAFVPLALGRMGETATIVGPQEPVALLWEALAPTWGQPRDVRWEQPHLQISGPPAITPDPQVRLCVETDFDVLYPACVAMYTEEVGLSPEAGNGAGHYRARVRQLIANRWALARFDERGVVFKAEVACATPHAAQVQGVWVRPDRRGQGLAAPGMAAVVEHVRREVAPVVSLYVNDWNDPARAAYERTGFVETARLATVMF